MKRTLISVLLSFALIVTCFTPVTYAASGNKRAASLSVIKKDGKPFDYRVEAGQKLYGYDTLQGACANKGIAYLTLYDRTVE